MQTGAITQYIDVAQVVLYAFWIFFIGLIVYLRREDKREGYPLESDRSARATRIRVQGFPRMPAPKTFRLAHGGEISVPRAEAARDLKAAPFERFPGSPLEPTGNAMADGVGPASYALRSDTPDLTFEGQPRIVPMRVATDFMVESRDPDPRGQTVVAADGAPAGVVRELWVDRSEPQIRYLEVELAGSERSVLLPIGFARFDRRHRRVSVRAILAAQFAGVPPHASPDQVTLLEEDRISAYYGGGTLYATASRSEPYL